MFEKLTISFNNRETDKKNFPLVFTLIVFDIESEENEKICFSKKFARCQFHQHFTPAFFVRNFGTKIIQSCVLDLKLEKKLLKRLSDEKHVRKMLMKLIVGHDSVVQKNLKKLIAIFQKKKTFRNAIGILKHWKINLQIHIFTEFSAKQRRKCIFYVSM